MRTLFIVISDPRYQSSMALTVRDPYHELTFETIQGWLHSATHRDVFRDKLDVLCNNHEVEAVLDVIEGGGTPTMHFIYTQNEWEDWIDRLAKAFVFDEPRHRAKCTVKAAAALLDRANTTISAPLGAMGGIAYIEEE